MSNPPPYPPPIVPADFKDVLDEPFAGPAPPPNPTAKTAPGTLTHNTLSAVTFGVVSIQVKTGSGSSKSNGGKIQPGGGGGGGGSDDFHYASGNEKLQVTYTIEDSKTAITQAKLELFTRFDDKPIWSKALDPADYTDGSHTLDIEPVPADTARFADGVLTVEHSPYKLKMTIGGKERSKSPAAWTFFHVLVADITLELGDPAVLEPGSKQVYDLLKESLGSSRLPKTGDSAELQLTSNIFKTNSNEMYQGVVRPADTSPAEPAYFSEYRSMWGKGPVVPIFAKVRVKDSANQPVDAPKALGRVRFLWDFEDLKEATDRYDDGAAPSNPGKIRAFIESALNYSKGVTTPKGDNCHEDRGGKRTKTPTADTAAFPLASGQQPAAPAAGNPPPPAPPLLAGTCPFEVVACNKRTWAAFSFAWTRSTLAGKTGVFFQPSRMAGDAYRVTVYLAYERKADGTIVLDTTDDAPLNGAVKAETGAFQVWRRVNLVKYLKKNSSLPGFDMAKLKGYFEKAFIRLVDDTGGEKLMVEADYNKKIRDVLSGLQAEVRALVDPAVNQYTAGDYVIQFRTKAVFLDELKKLDPSLNDPQNWNNFMNTGTGSQIKTLEGWLAYLNFWAMYLVERAFAADMDPREGINIFQWTGLHNQEVSALVASTGGWAADMKPAAGLPQVGRYRAVFVDCMSSGVYQNAPKRMPQTLGHEIGHLMFLPHTDKGSPTPGGPEPLVHDKAWIDCLMSYNHDDPLKFCGFCLLTLRGWDRRKLKNEANQNRKT